LAESIGRANVHCQRAVKKKEKKKTKWEKLRTVERRGGAEGHLTGRKRTRQVLTRTSEYRREPGHGKKDDIAFSKKCASRISTRSTKKKKTGKIVDYDFAQKSTWTTFKKPKRKEPLSQTTKRNSKSDPRGEMQVTKREALTEA